MQTELRVHDSEFQETWHPGHVIHSSEFGFWHYFISASMKIFIIPIFWNAPT